MQALLKRIILIFIFLPAVMVLSGQQPDTLTPVVDSIIIKASTAVTDTMRPDTQASAIPPAKRLPLEEILRDNMFIRLDTPAPDRIKVKHHRSMDIIFYCLMTVLLFLGILKTTYTRYFNNIFRVFFNTSLRQNQLTDQLLQAKFPSLMFNLFFIITSSLYIYLLLSHFGAIDATSDWGVLMFCVLCLIIIYTAKYCALKFTGWVSGYEKETDIYIFIIFLINKMIGISLVPIILVMAFSSAGFVKAALIISYVIIGFMLLMRFFRSYGLLQNSLKINKFHFLLYVVGVEILPLFLIYRAAVILFSKNL
jgi:hypothetical protein